MRELLRNPKTSFPQQDETVIVTSNGFPQYTLSANSVNITNTGLASAASTGSLEITKNSSTGDLTIHKHEKK